MTRRSVCWTYFEASFPIFIFLFIALRMNYYDTVLRDQLINHLRPFPIRVHHAFSLVDKVLDQAQYRMTCIISSKIYIIVHPSSFPPPKAPRSCQVSILHERNQI